MHGLLTDLDVGALLGDESIEVDRLPTVADDAQVAPGVGLGVKGGPQR